MIWHKQFLFPHHFCHPHLNWIYIEILGFYVSKKILLVVGFLFQFVFQFVTVLPMFHARTGNNKHTSQPQSFASLFTPISPSETLLQFPCISLRILQIQPFLVLFFPNLWKYMSTCTHFHSIKVPFQSYQQHLQAFQLETYTTTNESFQVIILY